MALSVNVINSILTFTCLCGLGLSIYSYTVELQLENDPNYSPMCDINQHMSCSKAFTSKYGKGFGIFGKGSPFYQPNSLFGIFFYSLIATLAQVNFKFSILVSYVLTVLSNLASIYFAYILYFKLQDFCVVCVSIYVVNFLNLVLIHLKLHSVEEKEQKIVGRGKNGKKNK